MDYDDVTEEQFEKALSENQDVVRGMQVLSFAFAMGITLFAAVIVFAAVTDLLGHESDLRMPLGVMSVIHAVVAFGMWTVGSFLFNRALKMGELPGGAGNAWAALTPTRGPASRCLTVIRAASLVRMATFEGPALFGLVICLLGVASGEIHTQPLYWLNALSAVVLFFFIGLTFPTPGRLMDTFRVKIEGTRELVSPSPTETLRR